MANLLLQRAAKSPRPTTGAIQSWGSDAGKAASEDMCCEQGGMTLKDWEISPLKRYMVRLKLISFLGWGIRYHVVDACLFHPDVCLTPVGW